MKTQSPKYDIHTYGYEIKQIPFGIAEPAAKFAICDPEGGKDGFYLECITEEEAERELKELVELVVADGY